ncbi:caffeoylshikimate esterase-like [Dioscorea cayenensis subsp. rotundata]|uniref:Caffeoylshikimate esterase-like n=1 Tax=Dioscorea cayennensis subsp. rotundata TaxID=55577 RepID=A0AB40D2X9_DIOCR|nr:caffeoylshikimate esterase-like [Dioscorea cayenensis subsp. rotundata]
MDQSSEIFIFEEEFIFNPRGVKLFTCRWLPKTKEPKALMFICHGYAMECSISMRGTGTRLAEAGYAVYGIDYEGHGKSSGLQGYIPSFDNLVNDCSNYFISICEKPENKKRRRFLLGESMGGAVLLLLHRKEPSFWDGAILVAPMCKLAEEIKPHPIVIKILKKLCNIIPTWKVTPTQDIIDIAFKSPEFRQEVRCNPYCYKGRPRLKTADELLTVSLDIEHNLHRVTLPFLVVHGGDDIVTDPSVSKLLYELAGSEDKTFKLYSGMWHALTSGEPPGNINLVFFDIIAWLDERSCADTATEQSSETELKVKHDQQQESSVPQGSNRFLEN